MKMNWICRLGRYLMPLLFLLERDGIALEVDDLLKAVPFQQPKYECGPNTTPSGH